MYASAIPFGLMFYLLFSPPAGIADSALFAWLAAFAIATRVSLTFFIVPYFAVGAELTENYRDRTSLVAYRTMFSFTSAIALSAVSFSVFFRATAEYAQGQLNPDAYPLFGLLCIYLFSFYDISRTSHQATLKTLHQRRQAP